MSSVRKDEEVFKILTIADLYASDDEVPKPHGPIVIDSRPVKLRGDVLSKIWWQGKQWAVTEYGIECRDGTYPIDAKKLTYDLDNGTDHGWVEQLRSKGWADLNDFKTAYFVALSMHGYTLSKEQLKKLRRHFTQN